MEPGLGGDRAILALLVVLVGVVITLLAGAELAAVFAHHHLLLSTRAMATALIHLPRHLADPRLAWPAPDRERLPGPGLYWLAQAVVVAVLFGGVVAVARLLGRHRRRDTARHRVRLGVETEARLATRADLAPLVVGGPTQGRFVLGTVGGRLVATEDPVHAPARRGARSRQGGRGSVCIFGPTQSGKTNLVKRGVLDWVAGPAVLGSVKADLLAHTAGARATKGAVKVFDPLETTGMANASWNPLDTCATVSGAQRFAAVLGAAAPNGGVTNADFFRRQAEGLLWALLYLAATTHAGYDMTDVVRWVMTHSKPNDAEDGQVGAALRQLIVESDDPEATELVAEALESVWRNDDRTRGSIYTTTANFTSPWMDQLVRRWTRTSDLSLDWLCQGDNTLYVCLPMGRQARLAPVFGGLYGALLDAAYEWYNRGAEPLDPTLLFVVDEAANTQVDWLPETAATCAGIGILLVTVWQGVSQLEAAFGRASAEAVVTNHPTKVFMSGLSDERSLQYVSRLLGDEEVTKTSVTAGGYRLASLSETGQQMRLVPMDVIRQVAPGEGVLLHRTLRPAHLRVPPYYRDRRLAALAGHPFVPRSRTVVCTGRSNLPS